MPDISQNNKRIAQNTLMLYTRMLLRMFAIFWTSRVALQTLGESDFGVYNVVAGATALLMFFNNTLSNAMQRFLSFEIGKNDMKMANQVFYTGIVLHIGIIIIILLLAETLGLWFINNKLNIPLDRYHAANILYQFSIITICSQIFTIPFDAAIVSFEKMKFYAFVGFIDILLQSIIILSLLFVSDVDKLVLYSFLIMVTTITLNLFYILFCKIKLPLSRCKIHSNAHIQKRMASFISWNILGSSANVFFMQGITLALNITFGVLVNAAIGIANQVSNAIYGFSASFQTAFKPQIIKYYANKEYEHFNNLLQNASKYTFLLLLFFSIPVLININGILHLWLTEVPEYTAQIIIYLTLCLLLDAITTPLYIAIQAIGKIKYYHIIMSVTQILSLILICEVIPSTKNPLVAYYMFFCVAILMVAIRLVYLYNVYHFSIKAYFRCVIYLGGKVTFIAILLPLCLTYYIHSVWGIIVNVIISLISVLVTIYFIGLTKLERQYVFSNLKTKFFRFRNG